MFMHAHRRFRRWARQKHTYTLLNVYIYIYIYIHAPLRGRADLALLLRQDVLPRGLEVRLHPLCCDDVFIYVCGCVCV